MAAALPTVFVQAIPIGLQPATVAAHAAPSWRGGSSVAGEANIRLVQRSLPESSAVQRVSALPASIAAATALIAALGGRSSRRRSGRNRSVGAVQCAASADGTSQAAADASTASKRVLLVIHGYPPLYNAGSEVYTQTLARALRQRGHEVLVFCREEDTIAPYYRIRKAWDGDIPIRMINLPNFRDRYRVEEVDQTMAALVDEFRPDIVHCGHLNHLSTSLVQEVSRRNIPFVYTLHDFWLMCPRGQFVQFVGESPEDLWPLCDGQENSKCSSRCYAPRIGSGAPENDRDEAYWTAWTGERMQHVKRMAEYIDLFVSPARHLLERFVSDGFVPQSKVSYLDYGFDRSRYAGRSREPGEPFTFAYIGTHKETKGVQDLIAAFAKLSPAESAAAPRLRIFGRPMAQSTLALRRLAASCGEDVEACIEWCGEYDNENIVQEVFNRVDAIVVPSIWLENSPLVIHEAQQAGILVITADAGGMAEYVGHERNGLLFTHRVPEALAVQMQRCVNNPDWARALGEKGYLNSEDGQIPSIDEHVSELERLYSTAIERRSSSQVRQKAERPFWRLTFDTNPDDCNLHCDMCEGFSQFSSVAEDRRALGLSKRRMDPGLMERVLREFVDMNIEWSRRTGECQALEVIPSTMGEPLLYRHFERFLEIIQSEGERLREALCEGPDGHPAAPPLGQMPPGPWVGLSLNLTTNGTFPRLGAERWADLILPVATDIKISWNGAEKGTQESIMKGQDFDKVLENVRIISKKRDQLAEAGGNRCRLTFQLTFLEENFEEIPRIVELAAEVGVDRVKGHHLWGHWPEMAARAMKRDASAVQRWNAMVPAAMAAAKKGGVLLEGVSEIPMDAAVDLAPGAPCPFLGKEAWVSAEGRFNPCCAPDEQRLTLGYFGHLSDFSLQEIASGAPYGDLKSTYSTRSLCTSCNMRRWPKGEQVKKKQEVEG